MCLVGCHFGPLCHISLVVVGTGSIRICWTGDVCIFGVSVEYTLAFLIDQLCADGSPILAWYQNTNLLSNQLLYHSPYSMLCSNGLHVFYRLTLHQSCLQPVWTGWGTIRVSTVLESGVLGTSNYQHLDSRFLSSLLAMMPAYGRP